MKIPVRPAVLAAAVAAALATASPVRAQDSGDGFRFGRPYGSWSLRGGFAMPSAGSDLFSYTSNTFTVNRGDFRAFDFGGDVSFTIAPRLDLVLDISHSGTNKRSEYRKFEDNNHLPIQQSTSFQRTPVTINLQYALGHYGPTSADEYGEIKRQLEATGLFKVNLQSTEWTTYSKQRRADAYPVYQLGWFPDFPDADNYISPFLVQNNFVGAHYCDDPKTFPAVKVGTRPCDTDKVLPLIATESATTGAARTAAIEQIQTIAASGVLPTLPLLQGKQIAVTGTTVTGVDKTLDSTFLFRFWLIGKSS